MDPQLEMHRIQLDSKGYTVIPEVLEPPMLSMLRRRYNSETLAMLPDENFSEAGAFSVADYRDPVMVELLTYPRTLQTLAGLGFAACTLHSFYASTKPPGSDALPWHSDLFYEHDRPEPAELFLLYYLADTTPENGCLRVVPGSHHLPLAARQTEYDDTALRADESDVPIRAGDLFVGDRRLLHATHPNHSTAWRTCITVAMAPAFDSLPDDIQELICGQPMFAGSGVAGC